jgi:hypothetical protein
MNAVRHRRTWLAAAVSLLVCAAAPAAHADNLAQAQLLFAQYQSLEQSFDPSLADLYSDRAVIKIKRYFADGAIRETSIDATRYKAAIRSSMAVAKSRGDYSTYSSMQYSAEGAKIRISAMRFSVRKRYSSPITLVIGLDGARWAILEEDSEAMR